MVIGEEEGDLAESKATDGLYLTQPVKTQGGADRAGVRNWLRFWRTWWLSAVGRLGDGWSGWPARDGRGQGGAGPNPSVPQGSRVVPPGRFSPPRQP